MGKCIKYKEDVVSAAEHDHTKCAMEEEQKPLLHDAVGLDTGQKDH